MKNKTLLLILLSIALNISLGQITLVLKLPVFLDSIGTIFAAILMGPWIGMITGVLSNLIWGFWAGYTVVAFAPVAVMIGLTAGVLARRGMFVSLVRVLFSSFVITIVLTLVATPIATYLFGGFTGAGADFLVVYLGAMERHLMRSVAWAVVGTNLIDKVISSLVACFLVKQIPPHIKMQFPDHAKIV